PPAAVPTTRSSWPPSPAGSGRPGCAPSTSSACRRRRRRPTPSPFSASWPGTASPATSPPAPAPATPPSSARSPPDRRRCACRLPAERPTGSRSSLPRYNRSWSGPGAGLEGNRSCSGTGRAGGPPAPTRPESRPPALSRPSGPSTGASPWRDAILRWGDGSAGAGWGRARPPAGGSPGPARGCDPVTAGSCRRRSCRTELRSEGQHPVGVALGGGVGALRLERRDPLVVGDQRLPQVAVVLVEQMTEECRPHLDVAGGISRIEIRVQTEEFL